MKHIQNQHLAYNINVLTLALFGDVILNSHHSCHRIQGRHHPTDMRCCQLPVYFGLTAAKILFSPIKTPSIHDSVEDSSIFGT